MCRWIAAAALLGLAACAEDETTPAEAASEGLTEDPRDWSTHPSRGAPTDTGAPPVDTAEAAHPAEHIDRSVTEPAAPARTQVGAGADPARPRPADGRAQDPRTAPPGAALPTVPRPQDAVPDQAPKSPSPLPPNTPPEKMPEQEPPSFTPPERSPVPTDPPNRVPIPGQMPDAVPLGVR
jgi:hypothetical protein